MSKVTIDEDLLRRLIHAAGNGNFSGAAGTADEAKRALCDLLRERETIERYGLPWKTEECWEGPGVRYVTTCNNSGSNDTRDNRRRLITHAPALARMLADITQSSPCPGGVRSWEEVVRDARELLELVGWPLD